MAFLAVNLLGLFVVLQGPAVGPLNPFCLQGCRVPPPQTVADPLAYDTSDSGQIGESVDTALLRAFLVSQVIYIPCLQVVSL